MIDPNLLRELGWSEKLINEVTRISKEVSKIVRNQEPIEMPTFQLSADSGNSIHFYASEINTDTHIRIQNLEKP